LFDFLVRLCQDTNLTKTLLRLADAQSLHRAIPYESAVNESSESGFGFDEGFEVDERPFATRSKRNDTPQAIIEKVESEDGARGQMALNLFLGGRISRSELSILAPSTKDCPSGGTTECSPSRALFPRIALD
jgi:hypothetical protein